MLYLAAEDCADVAVHLTMMTMQGWMTGVLVGRACPVELAADESRLQHA